MLSTEIKKLLCNLSIPVWWYTATHHRAKAQPCSMPHCHSTIISSACAGAVHQSIRFISQMNCKSFYNRVVSNIMLVCWMPKALAKYFLTYFYQSTDLCPASDSLGYDTCFELIFTKARHGKSVILRHHGHGHGAHARLRLVTHVAPQHVRHSHASHVAATGGPPEAQKRL